MNRSTLHYLFISCFLWLFSYSLNPIAAQTLFEEYPWLNEVVDTEDCCQNQTVTAYQSGIYTFIYIEKGAACLDEGNELYFQNGTFYCLDINGMDCRAAYGLTEENSTPLWDCRVQAEAIFTICAGDSLFLPALQDLPAPPLPPVGPSGEIPPMFCHPLVTSISINPANESLADGLAGFTVFPTTSTIVEIISSGNCEGPDAPYSSEFSVRYQVIVEEDCSELRACENVLEQEWLKNYTDEDCTGNIYQIEYNGEAAIYLTTLCACVDAVDIVYSCTGEELCANGGFINPEVACDPTISEQLILENLLWSPDCDCECPVDFTPVCGADGNTYETACEATCEGIEILDNVACSPSSCKAEELFNLGPNPCESCAGELAIYAYKGDRYFVMKDGNPFCSDGITVVINCDSTFSFCQSGGIAGFNECEDFFAEATLVEIIWDRDKDCGGDLEEVPPCTDLAGVDFGLCEAIMGVGIINGKCETISGCLDYTLKGVDYSEAFFPTVEICRQSCGLVTDESPEIFNDFAWLADIIDPNNCGNTTVESFDFGAYSFVYVQTGDSGELYYEDGTFYCQDFPDYDCRALYGLTNEQVSNSWICVDDSSGRISPTSNNFVQNNNTKTATLKAYPNPTSGFVQLQIDTDLREKHQVIVYDLYGRIIQKLVLTSNTLDLDLAAEQAGIYFVELQSGINKEVVKIVKQ